MKKCEQCRHDKRCPWWESTGEECEFFRSKASYMDTPLLVLLILIVIVICLIARGG